ncbi:hypothetical protein BB559_004227 [Furculomyces boomerangus]|uniref:DNA-directed RNA polymerase RBP11-like dimerisation domain-containing protein n=2 Tax=Harpellales TaxID=61421 RepID=A0A2T9YFY3_9FUNG|nr:hypothetical protein BB559_004227 [Furculomyces boomerangus]PWA01925.1 hypothetical protein BB558_001949 [Smittium angustum]
MNAPERFEMFVLPDGVKKIEMTPDPKIPNCTTFEIRMEDHTIANSIRYKLLENKNVIFAGYSMPHPLEYRVLIRVQTSANTKPLDAFQEAIQGLIVDFDNLRNKFEIEISRVRSMAGDSTGTFGGYGEFGMNQVVDPNMNSGMYDMMDGNAGINDDHDIDF